MAAWQLDGNHLGLVWARVGDVVLHIDASSVRVAGGERVEGVQILRIRRLGLVLAPIILQSRVSAKCQ